MDTSELERDLSLVNMADEENMIPLHRAAKNGALSGVAHILKHGADVNATDDEGRGALYYALQNRHISVVQELLKWKPQLNILTSDGKTLLQHAMGDVSMVEMLLDSRADPELPNGEGLTAINAAVVEKKADVVKLLVNRGVDIHRRDQSGWNPILNATGDVRDAKITRILLEGGASLEDTNPYERVPLHYAARETEVLKVLLEFQKDIDLEPRDFYGRTPLLTIDSATSLECIRLLLQAGADVNARDREGWSALMKVMDGRLPPQVADVLLADENTQVDVVGRQPGTALHVACCALNPDFVTKLLEHGADPNLAVRNYPGTALISACVPDDTDNRSETLEKMEQVVRTLIAHGADVNLMHEHTIYNALSAACFSGGANVIKQLLGSGTSAQQPDPLGRLPIHFAAANGLENFLAVIEAHKGNWMVPDCAGKNVLHWAAQFGHVETVKAILEYLGPSTEERRRYINLPDIDGWTPLCWATRPPGNGLVINLKSEPRAYAETVQCLLEEGADPSVEFYMNTKDGVETYTPVKMAQLCDAGDEMINLLSDRTKDKPHIEVQLPDGSPRHYRRSFIYCDICLNTQYGYSYRCKSCPDFDACKKCYGRIDIYHGHIRDADGETHRFKFRSGSDLEFDDQQVSSPSESPAND
ncbi:ankyrin repeat-containing domain protein [Hypoxylon trugodes]|uniref:ankyrin repeat-containing domain protein n=1 Tax=Hypoxylon trugodes TaxID=326681 RepID=UPI00218CD754|nr:ankyrin repeat-containing domain protein [Hypoxylon trugodes]KAI1390787.1 ankyrin repeat-containing domain protein [Hypoxylon trugodes]